MPQACGGVLDPALNHELIGEVAGVLQIVQSDHQATGHTGTASSFGVERTEALGGTLLVNGGCEFNQWVALINEIDQFGSKQFVLALKLCDFRLHHFPRFRLPLIPFMTIQTPYISSKR